MSQGAPHLWNMSTDSIILQCFFQCPEDDNPKSFKIYQIWLKGKFKTRDKMDCQISRFPPKSGYYSNQNDVLSFPPLNLPYFGCKYLIGRPKHPYCCWHVADSIHIISPYILAQNIIGFVPYSQPHFRWWNSTWKICNALGRFGGNPPWTKPALSCRRPEAIVAIGRTSLMGHGDFIWIWWGNKLMKWVCWGVVC